jgi:copper transport protein
MSFQFSVRPRADRVAWAPVWLPAAVIIAAGLALAAETLRLTNGDAGDLLGRDGWNLARDARHLPAALITISGAAALWLWIEWPRSWITAAASALMLALGLAWAGHSAAIDPRWLGTGIDTLHVVAVGAWAGGVATLAFVVLTRRDLPAASGLRRFSNTAGIAFAIAALSGLVLVREIAGGPGDLLESTWGRVLAVKVAVVLAAGVLAFVNRRHILRQIGGAGTATAGPLRRLVLAEAAALLLVVGLAATLTGQSPQDTGTDNAAAGRPYVADQFLGPYHVVVSLTPRAVGTNTLTVDFHGVSEGGETPPEAAEAVLSLADGPEGRYVLTNTAGSRFVGEGLEIGGPGDWTLTIELTLEGGETVSGAFPVRVNE